MTKAKFTKSHQNRLKPFCIKQQTKTKTVLRLGLGWIN